MDFVLAALAAERWWGRAWRMASLSDELYLIEVEASVYLRW
jgi:hypothetical protein